MLGKPHEAAQFAGRARKIAAVMNLPTALGVAERATCDVAFANSEYGAARKHALVALARFKDAGAVVEAEKTRVRLAQSLAALGQTGPAVLELTTAADRFDEWSAHGYRDLAERELRKLGRRQHRRSTQAPRDGTTLATLTGREREVATLVADGKTNPQIAAALFLSTKTVETHLRNTFHKLHVTSRMELARLVDRA